MGGKGQTTSTDVNSGWLRRLSRACWRYPRNVVLALGGTLVVSLVGITIPLIQRAIVDNLTSTVQAAIWPLAVALLVAAAANFAGLYVRRYRGGRLSLDVQHDLRTQLFSALSRLDGTRQDELHTGQIVSRSISDLTMIQALLSMVPMLMGNVVLFVGSMIAMAFLSPTLTLVALAVGPALWFIAAASRRTLFPASWDAQQRAAGVAAVVDEAVTGVRVVKGFGQEDQETGRIEQASGRLYAARVRAVRLMARYNPALQAVPALGQVGVLALGGWLALHGTISLGTFLAFSSYLVALVWPVRSLAGLVTIGQQARASVIRVFEVIDAEPVVTDQPGALPLPPGTQDVELDDVRFGYVPSQPVLQGLSLRVLPGETVALVGPAGSGKSTISLLLPRFYDVSGGALRVGGHDVRDLTQDSLRSAIGMVMEESFLFSDTVAGNIAFGRPDATREQVVAAARAAEADGFIAALPQGYDTVVGEKGLTLSGGQRQRVALARALLTDPAILVLDDATSAVDPQVEAEIHETLRRVMRGRTTLLIAHRRSTLQLAERIAVLDQGRLVDQGSHEDLMARCPLYRLLLAGPGEDAEGVDAGELAYYASGNGNGNGRPGPARSRLWPADAAPARADRTTASTDAGGGFLAGIPASPELLAQVDALPPATDKPGIDSSQARAADPRFTLRRLLRPFAIAFMVGLVLDGLDALANLAMPALVRGGIDNGVEAQDIRVVLAVSAAALLIVLADWVITAVQTLVVGRNGERLLYTLRVKIFAHLQRLGLDFYEREWAAGS
jgi:ATP-binding cassette, subfamily B, bacterial